MEKEDYGEQEPSFCVEKVVCHLCCYWAVSLGVVNLPRHNNSMTSADAQAEQSFIVFWTQTNAV